MTEYKDLRVKLSPEQKAKIKNRYDSGEKNRNKLAAEFGVSRGTINFIVKPEQLMRFKEKKKGRWKEWYTTEKASEWKRNFRARRKTV